MGLTFIGAGMPRTGTTSLKAAIEQLTGEPCFHMFELFDRIADDGVRWFKALHGELDEMHALLEPWGSAVDWPAALFWRELMEAHPEAIMLLSHRGDADTWWRSADRTVWAMMRRNETNGDDLAQVFSESMRMKFGFGDDWDDPAVARAAYDAHYDEVVATVPPDRLLIWQPGDGWEPLADALGVAAPDAPFPHQNRTAEFRERGRLDN